MVGFCFFMQNLEIVKGNYYFSYKLQNSLSRSNYRSNIFAWTTVVGLPRWKRSTDCFNGLHNGKTSWQGHMPPFVRLILRPCRPAEAERAHCAILTTHPSRWARQCKKNWILSDTKPGVFVMEFPRNFFAPGSSRRRSHNVVTCDKEAQPLFAQL